MTPTESDGHSLGKGLAVAIQQLRLVKGEVITLRRDLDQSRKAMCGMENDARDLGRKLDKCQEKVRKSADSRRALEIQFAERLRLSSAELELSRSQVEALELECSRATSLSTALQDRIYELEAQVTARRSTRNCHSTTAVNASSAIDAPEASRYPHAHGQADPSIAIGDFHLQFSTYYD